MIRQDKLTFIINFFKIKDYSLDNDIFDLKSRNLRFFSRFGVISKDISFYNAKYLIDRFIPINKHYNLSCKINHFTTHTCIESPVCNTCHINNLCDYYNKKNYWVTS